MAEKSGFFNARETEEGTYDREYDAEQFAEYFANFVSNGVYVNPTNQLKVVFNGSPDKPFVVVVRKGKAYIDGYWYELTEDMEVTISANTKSYAIKDVICCTLDKTERKISIILKEDVISDMPVNNNTQHDLVLSTVMVQPNVSKLNAEDITDKRPDKTYCGFVTGVVDQIDTTELFRQYDEAFKTWFNEIKDQLSTDAAGNLQKQIGLLNNLKTIVKDSIVNAINSLYDSIVGKTLKTLDEVKSNTEQGYYVDALAVISYRSVITGLISNPMLSACNNGCIASYTLPPVHCPLFIIVISLSLSPCMWNSKLMYRLSPIEPTHILFSTSCFTTSAVLPLYICCLYTTLVCSLYFIILPVISSVCSNSLSLSFTTLSILPIVVLSNATKKTSFSSNRYRFS